MEEIWKDIKGYEGKYMVSNLGRVKSLNYNNTGKEKILKPAHNRRGYLYVRLYKDGKSKDYRIHRLVLMAFQPVENSEQLQVDHINTIRTDNRLDNLRWTTAKENSNNPLSIIHLSEAQKGKFGVKHNSSISVVQLSLEGKLVEVYDSAMDAERKGFNNGNINNCIRGKRKSHGGYKWEYLYKYLLLKYPRIIELNLFGKQYNRKEVNN